MAEAHARTFCTEKEDSKMQKMMIHYNDVPIYPIVLSENFDALGEALDDLMIKDRKVCIVTDSHVADFYLEQVEHIVKEHCAAASHFIFPAGEESKTLTTVENLYEFLIQNKFERKDMLVALGGGVVGDLTGFTAATYLRGIRFIQIPKVFWHRWTAASEEKQVLISEPIRTWWGLFISQNWCIPVQRR